MAGGDRDLVRRRKGDAGEDGNAEREAAAKPVMVEGLHQPCREPWTADYLFPCAGWAPAGCHALGWCR